jgi:UPF0755 protein
VTWPRALGLLALAGVALLGVGAWTLSRALEPPATAAEPVLFEVPRGASLLAITHKLEAEGLIRNSRAAGLLARSRGLASSLRAGEYWVSAASTPDAIFDLFTRGQVATHEVVLPEGFTAAMVAERIEAAGLGDAEAFLAWVRDPASVAALDIEGDSLEGYLFPETYRLPRGLSEGEIARVFVDQFRAVWKELESEAKSLSLREVVILASIVEKETGVAEERPLIAAVFLNRLKRGMRLETDPTVIYGIPDFDGNLRRRDLENPENSYNTYRIPGLPPGPIANPGRDSLEAVLHPADVEYLFFVSRNDGTHRFSNTYEEHELAVNQYQKRRRR